MSVKFLGDKSMVTQMSLTELGIKKRKEKIAMKTKQDPTTVTDQHHLALKGGGARGTKEEK